MTPEFNVDFARGARIGLDEALFCESKTVDQISAIVDAVKAKTGHMLLTRLDQSKYEALLARHGAQLEYDSLSRTAIFGHPHPTLVTRPVAIVMAGTSDLPVGREAARTLAFAGQPHREYTDVGVAGLWRLLEKIEDIRLSPVVIVAAGMDAASGQRRRRSGFQPGDRVANVRRLRRGVGRRDSASRRPSQLCARNIGCQYRQWLWRGLCGLANIASPGGVANLGRSDCALGCFPYCEVERRNRQCPLWADTVEKVLGFGEALAAPRSRGRRCFCFCWPPGVGGALCGQLFRKHIDWS